jgi:release factor glutamine methyltransferase
MGDGSNEWTIGRLLNWTQQHLGEKGVEDPRLCAELLLAHALGCQKIELYTRFENVPGDEQRAKLRNLVRQAAKRVPIAYLTNSKEFFSLSFEVSPAVLIPRPETELLVEAVIDYCGPGDRQSWNVLEIGTGSGCIAVAITKYARDVRVVATDISADALAVAGRNVARHGVEERVQLVEAGGLALPPGSIPDGGFDIVVSNPPYVAAGQIDSLEPEVAEYEPRVALVAEGEGLAFYRLLAGGVAEVMWPGGAILVEIGQGQHEQVAEIFSEIGAFEFVKLSKDKAGIERVMQFRLSG